MMLYANLLFQQNLGNKNSPSGEIFITTADVGGTRAVGDPPLGERCSP